MTNVSRMVCVILWVSSLAATAQTPPTPLQPSGSGQWRNELKGLPEHPAAGTSVQDIDRFTQNVQMAAPYFATITPGDFEANREMVRRMWAYVMALDMMAGKNPALRPAASRARRAMNSFPIGFAMVQPPGSPQSGALADPPTPQKSSGPPFAMTAPHVENIPADDRATASDLSSRYASTAARAASVWQNVETLRQSLVSRGMTLNAATAASVGRLQADMDSASRSLTARDWTEASASLDRADAEIEKISKTVGR
jgi:hypothetical protein